MKLQQMKGSYNCIVSLGSSCEPAAHLRRKGLRHFAAPLDWVVSLYLADVNRLLSNRFSGYMELSNMVLTEGSDVFVDNEVIQPVKSHFVKDSLYNIISVHDFPVLEGQHWSHTYPDFKAKLELRTERLLNALRSSPRSLFIRWGGTLEEAAQLQAVLGPLTGGDSHVLLVNGIQGLEKVVDLGLDTAGLCALHIPYRAGDNVAWDYILDGISLV